MTRMLWDPKVDVAEPSLLGRIGGPQTLVIDVPRPVVAAVDGTLEAVAGVHEFSMGDKQRAAERIGGITRWFLLIPNEDGVAG